MMEKYFEALERLAMPDDLHIKECEKVGVGLTEDFDTVEQALLELKSIKEAKPNEALGCLEKIEKTIEYEYDEGTLQCGYLDKEFTIIKQALIKSQEPKHYLKWEDLKFTKKAKEMRVKLGDTTYLMRYYKVNDHTNKVCISSFQFIEIYDIWFFNDLHLEVVNNDNKDSAREI